MNTRKVVQVIPILTIAGILIYTWITIFTTDFFATVKHQVGLGLFIATVALYFIWFKYGVISTGVFLLLAMFNVISLFPVTVSSSYFMKIGSAEITTPSIQWKVFLLLVLFFICTGGYLIDLYKHKSDASENK